MKKLVGFMLFVALVVRVFADGKLYLFFTDKTVQSKDISGIDSIYFSESQTKINFEETTGLTTYAVSTIDSIKFVDANPVVKINYAGSSVVVDNPLVNDGVTITVSGADVLVNSINTNTQVNYELSGSTTSGSFKIYSLLKFGLTLNNVSIVNSTGPALNIQSKKTVSLKIPAGTVNSLADGAVYNTSLEDQKSTLFSEGRLDFSGSGLLTVNSVAKHAICSDDTIQISGGTIQVESAGKDGIHSKGLFQCTDGVLKLITSGDGIECETGDVLISGGTITTTNAVADTKGISSDYNLTILGGTITQTVSGNQSKGLRSKKLMTISGGKITQNMSGNVALVAATSGLGSDPAYCTAIKCDSDLLITSGDIVIVATGTAGKGISADKNLTVNGGNITITVSGAGAKYTNALGVTDSYNSSCITADGNILVTNGVLTLTAETGASGGKGISANGTITLGNASVGPVTTITTKGARFLLSGTDYCHPKTLVADKDILINNGTHIINSTDDGIHSETSVTLNGGSTTVSAISSTSGVGEGVEAPLIYFKGGTNKITASNDGVNATYGTTSGGTETNDNSHFYISGGTHFVNATSGDAIDSNGNITMTGGFVFANGPLSGAEEAADFNGSFNMNGGTFIGAGSSSNMTKAMSTTSTQPNLFISAASAISSSTMMTIAINGTGIISFKPLNGGYKFLISSPLMSKSATYAVYTGGTYTGGTYLNNYYSGGSFSATGATTKKSGTLSGSATLNSISF